MRQFGPVVATAILSVLALAGTVFNVPLFFGVDFLLGGIFTFIALRQFGLISGVIVALAAGSYTVVIWGHPYALAIQIAEAFFVGMLLRRRQGGNLLQWVSVYWLILGLPLVALSYHFILGMSWVGVGVVAFKQGVNQIFNALIATLLIEYVPRIVPGRDKSGSSRQKVLHLQTNMLMAFAFIPVLLIITLNARSSVDDTLQELRRRIAIRSNNVSQQILTWRQHRWEVLQAVAGKGERIELRDLALLRRANPDLLFIHVVNLDGTVRISTSNDRQAVRVVNFSDRQWFRDVVTTRQPIVSDALLGRTSHQLSIVLAVPIFQGERMTGVVATAVAGETLIQMVTASYRSVPGRITLIDSLGKIIGSTESAFKPLQSFSEARQGTVRDKDGVFYRLQPSGKMSAVQAWAGSFLVMNNVQDLETWTLVVEQPLRAYAEAMQESNLKSFALTFILAAVALILGHVVGRTVSRPLQRLSQATAQLGQGASYLPERFLANSHIEEIDSLAQSFHQMAQRLTDNHIELIRARDELELRVARRTAELQQRQNAIDEHAIVSITDAAGNIIYVNDKFTAISGYTREELLGQTHRLLNSDHHPPSFFDDMWATISHGRAWHGSICNRAKDGRLYWVASTIVPFLDANGVPYQYIGIRTDITAIKEGEELLIRARDEAEQASQAKSQFLSSMSHELRTPMNAILGFGQIMEFDETLSEENKDNLREILRAGQHLLALVNEVLDLARVESGQLDMSLEPVEVGDIVRECLDLVETLAAKRAIRIDHQDLAGAVVRADRTRLKQVILNLLSNAIKYNRQGGSVTVGVEPLDQNWLRILVTDTGHGIPADRLHELFQPFQRLGAENSAIEGTGIGLTITRRIVEMMGGRVDVRSEVGVGSTFWIELPFESLPETDAAQGILEIAPNAAPAALPDATGQHLVLYIEDNPANIKLVTHILGMRHHIHLLTAHTPELGIELALNRQPELILLDINMPGMDGYQVLKVLKAEPSLSAIPVIAVTANAMSRDIERGKAAGFADYLTKPLNVIQFMTLIDHYLIGDTKG